MTTMSLDVEQSIPFTKIVQAISDSTNDNIKAIRNLLEEGLDLNTEELLICAVRSNNLATVQLLLEYGANIDQKDSVSDFTFSHSFFQARIFKFCCYFLINSE